MATPATAPVPETAVPAAAASATAPEEEYVWENGRRHINPKFKSPYTLPNDEQEAQRLDRQHKQFVATLHDSLYRVPLKKEDMKEVLDLGTGTGIWATDFAENFPEARVVGVDISAIQTRPRPE
jgi:tRNA G46 methylase TrmB